MLRYGEEENEGPTVCVEHLRFVPCRPCGPHPHIERWSRSSEDVIAVRAHQSPGRDVGIEQTRYEYVKDEGHV